LSDYSGEGNYSMKYGIYLLPTLPWQKST